MKKENVLIKLKEELKHIPRISGDIKQNMLRVYYSTVRQNDLKKDENTLAIESLGRAIKGNQKSYPGFVPQFDKNFFK